MAIDWVDYIPWVYASVQVIVLFAVSIAGVQYVRTEFLAQKNISKQQELQIKIQSKQKDEKHETESKEEEKKEDPDQTTTNEQTVSKSKTSLYKSFCKSWLTIVWKMRSVYASFSVHVFDVLTDVVVLIEWWNAETNGVEIEHVNAKIMALAGIAILLVHKTISVMAFWAKERNLMRCILQFLDLLIFEEIYISHKKIVTQFKNQKQVTQDQYEATAIDTTNSFKFVRNLEAVFESIPQSVLQLVFLIRTGGKYETQNTTIFIISILSIIQSMISMTNSILKNDNTMMTLPKWKKHKQRLPPTIPFLKHAICRLSEVISRIGLLALFWAVCEGQAFSALLAFELIAILGLTIWDLWLELDDWKIWEALTLDDSCLRVQTIIILPSEFFYAINGQGLGVTGSEFTAGGWLGGGCECDTDLVGLLCGFCCCCYNVAVWVSTWCRCSTADFYLHVTLRIGASLMQWTFLISWALYFEDRSMFLFSFNHGLSIFIVSMVCYSIFSQYMYLFPNFKLPFGVAVRSRWGYAFNGELEDLQRLRLPQFPWKRDKEGKEIIHNEHEYWDINFKIGNNEQEGTSLAMFALSNNQHHIVEWLESEKRARQHKVLFNEKKQNDYVEMDAKFARKYIDKKGQYFS